MATTDLIEQKLKLPVVHTPVCAYNSKVCLLSFSLFSVTYNHRYNGAMVKV